MQFEDHDRANLCAAAKAASFVAGSVLLLAVAALSFVFWAEGPALAYLAVGADLFLLLGYIGHTLPRRPESGFTFDELRDYACFPVLCSAGAGFISLVSPISHLDQRVAHQLGVTFGGLILGIVAYMLFLLIRMAARKVYSASLPGCRDRQAGRGSGTVGVT